MTSPIVDHMMANDAFSRWLGIDVLDAQPGYCRLQMRVSSSMSNGFKVAHGGIAYSLADSALAFAANAHGEKAMSIDCSMSYLKAINEGDTIEAIAEEQHRSKRLGRYQVRLISNGKAVGLFHGTVMFLGEMWDL